MSKKQDPNRVSPKDIHLGDIIKFQSHLPEAHLETIKTNIGIVVGTMPHPEQENGVGAFKILPITGHPKQDWVNRDKSEYFIKSEKDIVELDLDPRKNYVIGSSAYIIPNLGTFLNKDKKGGVEKIGTGRDTPLFNDILRHTKTAGVKLRRFFDDHSKQMKDLQANSSTTPTSRVMDGHLVEKGKRLYQELERQDHYDATVISTKVKATNSERKIPRIRKGRLDGPGIIKDISIDDAVKANLLDETTASALTTEFGKHCKKPLTTLGEFYALSEKNPNAFQNIANASGIEHDQLTLSVKTAHDTFLSLIQADTPDESLTGINTNYDEEHQPLDHQLRL